MWGTSTVVCLIYYRLLNHQMHYMTAFPRFTAPGWIWGLAKVTAPCPPPPPPPSPHCCSMTIWNTTHAQEKKKYVHGIYFLMPLPVINNYKNNQNYLSFLPFCLSSLNQGRPLFLTGFTRIIMKNNDGVNGITFAEHLFVLHQYFFPHLTLQGSYKFKDFQVPHF